MTPFEKGYAAFISGWSVNMNPFDKDMAPHGFKRWGDGWNKAYRARLERMP